jgi:anthranilate synthase/aminodeoxychorismate synthase-like glutamine amidotransferase
MVLVIDNYDSFTYNLVQYLGIIGVEVTVARNDAVTLDDIAKEKPQSIIISPGPCTPKEAGISVSIIKRFYREIPILGVCLGHQSIGDAFGGDIIRATQIVHGKTSMIHHDGWKLFDGLPNPFSATRYHSLVIDRATLPKDLVVKAWIDDGTIMAIRHREAPTVGVQFHPESIATENGIVILRNFLEGKY